MFTNASRRLRRNSTIRVLVVDDSVVVRNMVSVALKEDPALEVVGTAAHGEIGLAKIPQLNPDVITLDIEMPEMNGIEMLRRVRQKYPEVVVIIFSTLSTPGANATLEALMAGANDYVAKPSNAGSLDKSIAVLRGELIPKIKQFFQQDDAPVHPQLPEPGSIADLVHWRAPLSPAVLAVGVSTGGPNALATVVSNMPSDFSYPVLIVQHMPKVFTRLLAERLQKLTSLRVEEAKDGAAVEPGSIYIAPGDFHMRVQKVARETRIVLDQSMPRNSCRPSVDVLFESVEETYHGETVAVILTGMGQDGLRGVRSLKAAGAYVIAQDEASSVVWGMPGFVVKAGLADEVVALSDVVPSVLQKFSRSTKYCPKADGVMS